MRLTAAAALGPALMLAASAVCAQAASAPAVRAKPHVTVIEDDNVRIEESRARGNRVSRIVVNNKLPPGKPYDIEVAPVGRDKSQDKGNAGKSAWSVLSF
jgi:hypothetical protein